MMTLCALVLVAAAGVFTGRMWMDETLKGQEAAHKRQMDELWEEVKRSRAQVADLIGKE